MDARLSWPRWWLHPKIVYLPKMVTYLRNNQAVSWAGLEPNIAIKPKNRCKCMVSRGLHMFPKNIDHVMPCSPGTWHCTDKTGATCLLLHITWRALDQSWSRNSCYDIAICGNACFWKLTVHKRHLLTDTYPCSAAELRLLRPILQLIEPAVTAWLCCIRLLTSLLWTDWLQGINLHQQSPDAHHAHLTTCSIVQSVICIALNTSELDH